MTTTMLVPLDGSPLSEAILPLAEAVAAVEGLNLRLLGVVEPATRGLTERSERIAGAIERTAREHLEARFAALGEELRGRGHVVSHMIALGDPADRILAAADAGDVDLIAMATNGRGGADRWALGSVADKVMRQAQRPTLLFRPPYQPYPWRAYPLKRLLVPLDGSPLAEEALDVALPLAGRAGASLVLSRVEPWATAGLAPLGTVPEYEAREAEVTEQALAYLTSVRERLASEIFTEPAVLRGRTAESLIGYILHERIDLVVLTTHGRGGVRRFVLGSTAERLVRSGAPVLLVRTAPST